MAKRVGRLLTRGDQFPSDDADIAFATRGPLSNEREVKRQMAAAESGRKLGGRNRDYRKRPLTLGRSMKGRR